jgi:hypothetical protein
VPVTAVSNFANGALNAGVFGVPTSHGFVHLDGLAAAQYGAMSMASGVTASLTAGVPKALFFSGLGGRVWHRQGVAEYLYQLPWRVGDRMVAWELRSLYLASLDPSYLRER